LTKNVRLSPGDVLRLGFIGVRVRKLRAALSALGICIGIATMIVVTGIPASSQEALLDQLTALGSNLLQAVPEPNQTPPITFEPGAAGMVRRIGPVTDASALGNTHQSVQRTEQTDPNSSVGVNVLAADDELPTAINATLHAGSFLSPSTDRFPTVVLGFQAATILGINALPPGQPLPQIYLDHRWFTVIGILDPTPLATDIEQAVLVGWPVALADLGFDGRPTEVYLKAREDAIDDVRAVLPATLEPEEPGMVIVSRPSDALAAKRATENTFSSLFIGLAGVALLVGGIGVANTMVISVLERRREIGLRRALGASRGQIRGQFLTEAVLLSAFGGIIGTILGAFATLGYAAYQDWPPVIPLSSVAASIGGALLVGVIAGVYPSIRAARLTPTEALATT
jgi:putative ABC transport system permease protein